MHYFAEHKPNERPYHRKSIVFTEYVSIHFLIVKPKHPQRCKLSHALAYVYIGQVQHNNEREHARTKYQHQHNIIENAE